MPIRLVGDIHGEYDKYFDIIKDADYSVQVGDMGFSYLRLQKIDHKKHVFIGGNHENYDIINKYPHCLGDYGYTNIGGFKFFYVRGAFSIDIARRLVTNSQKIMKCWWEEEQLTFPQMLDCYEMYCDIKPSVVISHTAPTEFVNKISNPDVKENYGFERDKLICQTQGFLQYLVKKHRPDYWYCGHFHTSAKERIHGTTYQCLNILEYVDLPLLLESK